MLHIFLFLRSLEKGEYEFRFMSSEDHMRSMSQTDHRKVNNVGNRNPELKLRGEGFGELGIMKVMNELRREKTF